MLRGSEVSSRAGGMRMGDASLLQHRITAWICMAERCSSALCLSSASQAHGGGSRPPLELLHYTSTATSPPLPCCILAVAFPHTAACLCLPGAVTFSLLALAHGKFAQSNWYEVRPSNEAVTCCCVHTDLPWSVFVSLFGCCQSRVTVRFTFQCLWSNVKNLKRNMCVCVCKYWKKWAV